MIPVVRKIVLVGGIIIAVAIIGVLVSLFSVPPTPITCKAPFEISEGQCLCPGLMNEVILDDGSKSCNFERDVPDFDFCKEFPEECGPDGLPTNPPSDPDFPEK